MKLEVVIGDMSTVSFASKGRRAGHATKEPERGARVGQRGEGLRRRVRQEERVPRGEVCVWSEGGGEIYI